MGKAFNLDDFWEGAKGEGEGRTTGVDAVDGGAFPTLQTSVELIRGKLLGRYRSEQRGWSDDRCLFVEVRRKAVTRETHQKGIDLLSEARLASQT